MALVPYRVSGPSADQRATERLLQLPGGITVTLKQLPTLSGAQAPQQAVPAAAGGPPLTSLANVGLVVWQAGFLLADFLLRQAPLVGPDPGAWRLLTAVDLGTGSGVVGIALALAGARVYLTDLPHVLPLAAANVAANCDPRRQRTVVCPYAWGDDPEAAAPAAMVGAGTLVNAIGGDGAVGGGPSPLAGVQPDLITAADVLYHPDLLAPLMRAIQVLSAPHTVTYVSYRVRQGDEVAAFLALAEAAGFAAAEVPDEQLHEEYRAAGAATAEGGRAGAAGLGCQLGDRGGTAIGVDDDAGSDDDLGSAGGVGGAGEAGDWLAVERGGTARCRRRGSYGILRLCKRDCALAAVLEAKGSGLVA